MRSLIFPFVFAAALLVPSVSQAGEAHPDHSATLAPLQFLIGEWQGTDPDGKPVRVNYRFTSGGSGIVETMLHGDKDAMMTIYHRDGDSLMVTHYCAVGNQPRMRAPMPKGEAKTIAFKFVDATNLAKPTDPHMRDLTITTQDKDHFSQQWMYSKDGQKMPVTIAYERVMRGTQ